MRFCPLCSSEFDEAVGVCPRDGTLLASDPLVGATVDGKYRIEARLGAGGMGAVYRGTQLALQRPVAIKVVLGASSGVQVAVKRFEREALAVARLRHPHIVAVHDYGVAVDVGAYLVLEYLEGSTLRDELRRRGALPLSEAIAWFGQICSAVQAAHVAGLIHRDLKPDNIVLEQVEAERVAKVLDFGIARFFDESDHGRTPLTGPGGILGTPYYMSPEQCRGEPAGPQSDVYALGCVLFQMATGRPPFEASSAPALLYQHVSVAPPPPSAYSPSIPSALSETILRALAKDPRERFDSAAAFRSAVTAASAGDSAATLPLAHGVASEGIAGASNRVPNNLPAEMSRLIGRDRDVAGVRLVLPGSRLVTVTGPGGIGKTRLVLSVASSLLESHADGVWLADLGSLADPGHVAGAVADVFGLGGQSGRSILDVLLGHLRNRRLLLVLDNCDQVIDACATLATALLRGCPNLKLLASSREPLAIDGEHVYPLEPLAVASEALARTAQQALEWDAIGLFVERAKAARPSWKLTDADAPLVARLCARLDGIPLAIELAAARVHALSVGQILDRIGAQHLLAGGSRSVPARHRTLDAAIDWSYNLLSADERLLLERMSIFAGGWTLEAAEAVGSSDELDTVEVLPLLIHLVEKSLVVMDERPEATRYRMLETIRAFAGARLPDDDREAVAERHRAWVLHAVEAAFVDFGSTHHDRWRRNVGAEHANALAALADGRKRQDPTGKNLQLALALGAYWEDFGHWELCRNWIEYCQAASPDADGVLRARAKFRLASISHRQGFYSDAESLFRECLSLLEGTDRLRLRAEALSQLGRIVGAQGRLDEKLSLLTEAVGLHRSSGTTTTIASVLQGLGETARQLGELREAEQWLDESLDLFRNAGFSEGISVALLERAKVSLAAGDAVQGYIRASEALDVARAGSFELLVSQCQAVVGESLMAQGEWARARTSLSDALRRANELGAVDDALTAIEGLARVALNAGDGAAAFRLACFVDAHRESMHDPLPVREQLAAEAFLEQLRGILGAAAADACASGVASMQLADAVALAMRGGGQDTETERL